MRAISACSYNWNSSILVFPEWNSFSVLCVRSESNAGTKMKEEIPTSFQHQFVQWNPLRLINVFINGLCYGRCFFHNKNRYTFITRGVASNRWCRTNTHTHTALIKAKFTVYIHIYTFYLEWQCHTQNSYYYNNCFCVQPFSLDSDFYFNINNSYIIHLMEHLVLVFSMCDRPHNFEMKAWQEKSTNTHTWFSLLLPKWDKVH